MAEFVLTLSTMPLRRQALRRPVTTPTTMATNVPTKTRGIVFPSAVRRVDVTGTESTNDTPMFAWKNSWLRYRRYCCTKDRSRPNSWVSVARSSGDACGERRALVTALPGRAWNNRKLIVIATNTVINANAIRLRTYSVRCIEPLPVLQRLTSGGRC